MFTHPGPRIKRYMEENGIKQIHIAKVTGIPIQSFNAMCNAKQRIQAEQYFEICMAIGVSPAMFMPPIDPGKAV